MNEQEAELKAIQGHRIRTKELLEILDEQYKKVSDQLQSARLAKYGLCIGDRVAVTDDLITAMPLSSDYHNDYYRCVGCQICSICDNNTIRIQGLDVSPWTIGGIPVDIIIAAREVYLKNMEAK